MPKAKDIMTVNPKVCRKDDTIFEAVKIMRDKDCGVVPIVDTDERCVGIITDRDICLSTVLNRLDSSKTKIIDIMTKEPITCSPEDSLDTVIHKMEVQKIRRIPVVDKNYHCIGIISEADVALKDPNKEQVAELVEAVSA